MADENDAGSIVAAVEADAAAKMPVAKKQRAPRRQKAIAEATVAASAAKVAKGRRKRGEQAGETTPTPVEALATNQRKTRAPNKGPRKNSATKQAGQAAEASVPAIDEFADLIQLEEENKRLRKTLADKLRAENADLRKRLGLA
uniref:Putative transcriptional regulator syrB2 n=1 Tax=Rhizobium rhizogenes TaxID=359 RepID=A0A7S4ZT98_RHIRH|nr:SyrB-like regulator [Rhizobium rhizogenes]QCL09379.1 putative transcriptional regulator syrB2 [Rhizobium rhizogenes]QCL09549.1 putative transcriptional regulator syrB2 [Rhizobium rhizogenes]